MTDNDRKEIANIVRHELHLHDIKDLAGVRWFPDGNGPWKSIETGFNQKEKHGIRIWTDDGEQGSAIIYLSTYASNVPLGSLARYICDAVAAYQKEYPIPGPV